MDDTVPRRACERPRAAVRASPDTVAALVKVMGRSRWRRHSTIAVVLVVAVGFVVAALWATGHDAFSTPDVRTAQQATSSAQMSVHLRKIWSTGNAIVFGRFPPTTGQFAVADADRVYAASGLPT